MKKIFSLMIAIFLVSFTFAGDFKFKIIPLPYAYFSGDEFKVGLYLTIPDLFRKNSSLTLNGLYSKSTKNAGISINFPAVDAKRPGFQTKFSYGQYNNQYSINDYDNSSYYYFQKKGIELEQSALGKFFNGKLESKLSIGYMRYAFDSIDFYVYGYGTSSYDRTTFAEIYEATRMKAKSDGILSDFHYFYISLGAKYTFSISNILFKSEKSILTKFSAGFQDGWEQVYSFTGQAVFQHPIVSEWLRYDGNISGYVQTTSKIFLAQTGADVGLTILNPKYVFSKVLGISSGLEFAPVKIPLGVLSVYISYQYARYDDENNNSYPNHGFVFGLRAYDGDSSSPIGSASLSYNATKERFYGHIGVALSL